MYIGRTFPTPRGAILTVVKKNPKVKGKTCKWSIVCSLCSEDEELFPKPFTSTKGNLQSGQIPCGCSPSKRWSEREYVIKVQRKCEEVGYKFKGFSESFHGCNTLLKLECNHDGNMWQDTSITDLLTRDGNCFCCRNTKISKSNTKPSEFYVSRFRATGSFSDKDMFYRSDKKDRRGSPTYWNFKCNSCNKDEYVVNNLCSGLFITAASSLGKGIKPCRCSINFQWTKEQREYQIHKILSEEGGNFIGWLGKFKGSKSKFKWVCKEGHPCTSSVDKFINSGTRCQTCSTKSRAGNGLYTTRLDEVDYLYIMQFGKCIKVGRSFDVLRRKIQLGKISGIKPEILDVFSAPHAVVYEVEQKVQEALKDAGHHVPLHWTGECFDASCYHLMKALIMSSSVRPITH